MVFFIVVGILLSGFVIVPGVRNISVLLEQQRVLEETNAELQDIMTSRDRLQAEYSAIPEEHIAKLNLLIPEKSEIGALLSVYESVAKLNGLSLISVDFGAGGEVRFGGVTQAWQGNTIQNQKIVKLPESGIAELPVTQSLRGSYDAFRKYLADLEFLLNLTDITDISFDPADLQNVSFSLRGTTYYFQK